MGRTVRYVLGAVIAFGIFILGVAAGERGVIHTPLAPTPTAVVSSAQDDVPAVFRRLVAVNRQMPESLRLLDQYLQDGWSIERVDSYDPLTKVYFLRWPASKR